MNTLRWPLGLASGSRHTLHSGQSRHWDAKKRKDSPSLSPWAYALVLTTPFGQVQLVRSVSTTNAATVKRFGSLPPLIGTAATMVVCPALHTSTLARTLPQPA